MFHLHYESGGKRPASRSNALHDDRGYRRFGAIGRQYYFGYISIPTRVVDVDLLPADAADAAACGVTGAPSSNEVDGSACFAPRRSLEL